MTLLPRRQYQRNQPGRTERVAGIVILSLVGLLIATFILTSGFVARGESKTDASPSVDASASKPSQRETIEIKSAGSITPREQRVVRQLFVDELASWQLKQIQMIRLRDGKLQMAEPVAWLSEKSQEDALVSALDQAGVQQVYAAEYMDQQGEPMLDLLLIERSEPADAFLLCRSRMAEGDQRLDLAYDGWQREGGRLFGFWRGRFYIECHASADLSEDQLTTAAKKLAEQYLLYGRPLSAERLLPAGGRIADSLRYVRSGQNDQPIPAEIWLADYESDATAGVSDQRVDLDAVMNALSACGQEQQQVLNEMQLPDTAVTGCVDNELFVYWPADGQTFLVRGANAESVRAIAEQMLTTPAPGGEVSTPVADTGAAQKPEVKPGKARFAEVPDAQLQAPEKIERYTDDLYEKINGKEPMFRAFGFVELRFGQYAGAEQGRLYDVYIYDMGVTANALGIFMAERSYKAEPVDIGRGGYVSDASVYFYKNRYYVNVLGPADAGAEAVDQSRQIARAISDTIAADPEPFWVEQYLPEEGRQPHSVRYYTTSAMGFEFLNEVFMANYAKNGQEYQIFLKKAEDAEAAAKVFGQFVEATAKYDTVLSKESTDDRQVFVGESLGYFMTVIQEGRYLGGVVECEDKELAKQQAEGVMSTLPED